MVSTAGESREGEAYFCHTGLIEYYAGSLPAMTRGARSIPLKSKALTARGL